MLWSLHNGNKKWYKVLFNHVIDFVFSSCRIGKFYLYLWNYRDKSTPAHFVSVVDGVVISDEPESKREKTARTLILEPNVECKERFKKYIGLGINTACAIYKIVPKRQGRKRPRDDNI